MDEKFETDNREQQERRGGRRKSHLDYYVVWLCVSGIVISLFLFYQDMFMTQRSLNVEPAGTVSVKYNTVQRRFQDRMIWDRLFDASDVFNGDLIRVARQSGAVLNIGDSLVELGENTIIRIQKDADKLQIDFFSGEININSAADSGAVLLSMGDRVIEAAPGAVFSASSGDEGIVVRVTEGAAQIIRDGQVVDVPAGGVIVQDVSGNNVLEPMAFITHPSPNARFLKTDITPLNVEFAWTRMNMQPQDRLRLEIAQDRNFTSGVQFLDGLDSRAVAAVDPGLWHWRLSLADKVLTNGRITVTEVLAPVALTPENRSFTMSGSSAEVQLRWSEIPDAIYYNLQITSVSDFSAAEIDVDVQGTFFVTGSLGEGTWYWRVQPVFSNVFHGEIHFSRAASFVVEQGLELQPPTLNTPPLNGTVFVGNNRGDFYFSWATERDAISYTFLVSAESNLDNPVITRTTRNNFYVYEKTDTTLVPGRYFWSVSFTDFQGNVSPMAQASAFITVEREVVHRLVFPPDRYSIGEEQRANLSFSWETNLREDLRFQVSSSSDFSTFEINEPVQDVSYGNISLAAGEWYWRISARQDGRSVPIPSSARSFTIRQAPVRNVPPPQVVTQRPPAQPTQPTQPQPQPTQPAPTQPQPTQQPQEQQPAQEQQPVAPTQLNLLPTAQQTDELPAQVRVLPVPLLSAPENRLPEDGYVINAQMLREQRNITFSWSEVEDANFYELTIFSQAFPRNQQVFKTEPLSEVSYTFENLQLLAARENFYWQVEALFLNEDGVIERRGITGENAFRFDVPRPGRVQTREPGVMYGTQ
jgi:hypothetical protein